MEEKENHTDKQQGDEHMLQRQVDVVSTKRVEKELGASCHSVVE